MAKQSCLSFNLCRKCARWWSATYGSASCCGDVVDLGRKIWCRKLAALGASKQARQRDFGLFWSIIMALYDPSCLLPTLSSRCCHLGTTNWSTPWWLRWTDRGSRRYSKAVAWSASGLGVSCMTASRWWCDNQFSHCRSTFGQTMVSTESRML